MKNTQLQLPMRFEYYLESADLWSEILTPFIKVEGVITELCPGWAPKILLALNKTSFSGTYTAVDSSKKALLILQEFYQQISPEFSFTALSQNVLTNPAPKSNILILNHILDDLILLENSKQDLEDIYSITSLKNAWQLLAEDPQLEAKIHKINNLLIQQIKNSLLTNGTLFIYQYPSYQDKLHTINHSWDITEKMLKQLIVELLKDKTMSQIPLSKNITTRYTVDTNQFYILQKNDKR